MDELRLEAEVDSRMREVAPELGGRIWNVATGVAILIPTLPFEPSSENSGSWPALVEVANEKAFTAVGRVDVEARPYVTSPPLIVS